MIPEGKPIYLTEEQWDWLYDYILYANRDMDLWQFHKPDLGEEHNLKEKWAEEDAMEAYFSSLREYTNLFEKDINSFLETNMPNETFRCVGCNKKLMMRHMRVVVEISKDQKIWMGDLLKDQINFFKAYGNEDLIFPTLDDWSDREKILMLLRNAYRIICKTPRGSESYFDPYTVKILYDVVDYYANMNNDYDAEMTIEMIIKAISSQMEKPLCRFCVGGHLSTL